MFRTARLPQVWVFIKEQSITTFIRLQVTSGVLKAVVIKADRYEPELNRLMEDFANHYGIAVIPARAVKPKDKAAVENEVKIIYRRVYAKLRHHTFFSIDEINQAFAEKIREHNQTRQQQKDYCRQEKFLAEEKALLKELPKETFEVKYYTSLKIALNNCVYLARDKHYYSAPFQYIGQQADIIYTRSLVRIYVRGECVATHKHKRQKVLRGLITRIISTKSNIKERWNKLNQNW